jgi:recombination protein RecA
MTTPEQLAAQINKALGGDVLSMASSDRFKLRQIVTGNLFFDCALGGGVPRNRITELYGGFSSLKSFLCYVTIAAVQQQGGAAALADTENVFDADWAQHIGVDIDSLIMIGGETAEQKLDASDVLVRNGIDLIVWDSVAATLPKDEHGKSMHADKLQPGRQAAFMSAGLRKLISGNVNTALIFTNQTREKIGVTFGSPETTPGGRSLPFYASHRLNMRRGARATSSMKVWTGGEYVDTTVTDAFNIHAKLEKSKITVPGREFVVSWSTKLGAMDEVGFAIGVALENGWIKRPNNTTWQYGKTTKKGKEAFKAWIATEKMEELTARIQSTFPSGQAATAPAKSKVGKRKLQRRSGTT